MNSNQRAPSPFLPFGLILYFLILLVRTFAYSVEVFLRRRFGIRYGALESGLVLLLVPVYAAYWEGHDVRPLAWFLMAYAVVCVFHRLGCMFRSRRSPIPRTYTGWPRLATLLPWLSEKTLKLYVEPFAVVGLALLFRTANPPLCIYLCIAGYCLMIHSFSLDQNLDREASDMYDRAARQQAVVERFREKYGDRF